MKTILRYRSILIIITTVLVLMDFLYVTFLPFQPEKPTINSTLTIARNLARSIYYSYVYRYPLSAQDKINPHDKLPLIEIPEGSFLMGSSKDPHSANYPEHLIKLSNFYIDKFEVTNRAYRICVFHDGCELPVKGNPFYNNPLFLDYPVVYIDWGQAKAYCKWSGGSLPSEAEWEKAARGERGNLWPWGKEAPSQERANFGDMIGTLVSAYTYPDGESQYGVVNMAGNVREWVADMFNPTYYKRSPSKNPTGPNNGDNRSLRGGSFLDDANQISSYNRFQHEPGSAGINRGFRCVYRTIPSP